MLHQVSDDDGGRAGHPRLTVDEQPLPALVSFLCNQGEKQEVREGERDGGREVSVYLDLMTPYFVEKDDIKTVWKLSIISYLCLFMSQPPELAKSNISLNKKLHFYI